MVKKEVARVILLAEDADGFSHVFATKGKKGDQDIWVFPGTEIRNGEKPEEAARRIGLEQLELEVDLKFFAEMTAESSGEILVEHFYLAAAKTEAFTDKYVGGKGNLLSVNLLLKYPVEPKEIRDHFCKSQPAKGSIEFHRGICEEVTTIGLRELEVADRKIHSDESDALKERGDLNYLMFAIVGAVLTFNKDAIRSPIVLFGMIVLIRIAIISYVNIRRKRMARLENFTTLRNGMDKLFRNCLNTFNEHAGSLNSYTEQIWRQAVVDFKTWRPENIQLRKEKLISTENRYFIWLSIGLSCIGLGLLLLKWVNWGSMHKLIGVVF